MPVIFILYYVSIIQYLFLKFFPISIFKSKYSNAHCKASLKQTGLS